MRSASSAARFTRAEDRRFSTHRDFGERRSTRQGEHAPANFRTRRQHRVDAGPDLRFGHRLAFFRMRHAGVPLRRVARGDAVGVVEVDLVARAGVGDRVFACRVGRRAGFPVRREDDGADFDSFQRRGALAIDTRIRPPGQLCCAKNP